VEQAVDLLAKAGEGQGGAALIDFGRKLAGFGHGVLLEVKIRPGADNPKDDAEVLPGIALDQTAIGERVPGCGLMRIKAISEAMPKRVQGLLARPDRVNGIVVKLSDPYLARVMAARIEAQLGYKSVSWQEASEDIMSKLALRSITMYGVVS